MFKSLAIYLLFSAVFVDASHIDLMTNLEDVNVKELNSRIETVQFILRVRARLRAITCDTYATFSKVRFPLIKQYYYINSKYSLECT